MYKLRTTRKHWLKIIAGCGLVLTCVSSYAQMGWKQMASLPGAVREYVGEFVIGNYGYVGAGYNGVCLNDCYKWDQLTNTWSAIASYPGAGLWSPTTFAIEGKGYFGLGEDCSLTKHSDLWQYDPIANTWTAMASLPAPGRYDAPCFILGHKAWVVGGSFGGPPYTNEVWMYDAHQNTWTKMNNFPGGLWEGMVTFAIGNRGYAGCGWDGSNEQSAMFQYDTTTDTWTPIAAFPGGGTGLGGIPHSYVIGSKAYVCTGKTGPGYALPVAWIYDTVTKAWCPFSRLGNIARAYGVAFQVNNVGYIGMGTDTNGTWNSGPYKNDLWGYYPSSSFTVSDTDLCSSPSVQFSGITTLDTTESVTWSWTFTGGTPTTSTSQYPTVTYTAGTYTVQLIVSDCGIADTVTKTIQVIGNYFPIKLGGNTGICTGQSDTLTVSGGTSYSWSNGATTTSIIINPSSNTTYTVHVTNGSCSRDTTITVKVNSKLPVTITGLNPICPGSSDTLKAWSGSWYTYLWNTGATTSSIVVSPTVNTTYSVVVSNGVCTGDTSFNVAIVPFPKLTLTASTTSLCSGDSATLTIGGATSYVWSTGSTATSIKVAPTKDSTYSVTASNGPCTKDTSVRIIVNIKPSIAVSGTMAICYGSTTTLSASGGERYKWIPSTGLNCDSCSVVQANPGVTTTYTVVAINGPCTDTTTAKVSVSAPPKGSVCCSDTIQMGDTALITTADSGADFYLWSPNNNINCLSCSSVKVWPQFTTTYYVVMSDSSGCEIMDSVRIFVEACSNVWIPNAFTPNGDGLNDMFAPKSACMVGYTMDVFDRWGNLVYTTNDSKPWDGTYRGSNTMVEQDTYVYVIVVTDGYMKTHKYIGRVTVLK